MPAVPQLTCLSNGGSVCDLYTIDVLRCKNQGSDYDKESVQWTCTANLPAEFKLGSTDVICEGYESSNDRWVLKGSCGVEYRLLLTEAGEEKFGRRGAEKGVKRGEKENENENVGKVLFFLLFFGVVLWMLYAIFIRDAGTRVGGGGGAGGGGGGGPGGADDPPPPYDSYLDPKLSTTYNPPPAQPAGQGWRPGFWTGAMGGAAAGYAAGSRGRPRDYQPTGNMWESGNGEGSSRWGGGSAGSSASSFSSSTRHESSGFGSTSRR